jgi:hypothetical protein
LQEPKYFAFAIFLLLLMRLITAVHDVRVYKPDFCILMVIKERLGGA